MAEDDPLACLPLEPGERVLWTGRAAVSAPWPSFAVLAALLALVVAGAVVVVSLAALGADVVPFVAVLFGATGAGLVVIMASKLVGPSYVPLTLVLLFGAGLSVVWFDAVRTGGWDSAMAEWGWRLIVIAVVFVGLPALRVYDVFAARQGTRYVITDRRVAAVSVRRARPRRLWVHRHTDPGRLRVIDSWRTPGPVLFVGERELHFHELHLRDDDPQRVLADVTRALAAERT